MEEKLNMEDLSKVSGGWTDSTRYRITADCICCGVCEDNCPTNCIRMVGSRYFIPVAQCIGCGACYGNCPVGAVEEVGPNREKVHPKKLR